MAVDPNALVNEFFEAWDPPDPDALASFFAEDATYHNIPLGPVQGREAIRDFIAEFMSGFVGMVIEVVHQVSDGNLVMTERIDTMQLKEGGVIRLPVMGVFEIVGGQIASWREYFDMAPITSATRQRSA